VIGIFYQVRQKNILQNTWHSFTDLIVIGITSGRVFLVYLIFCFMSNRLHIKPSLDATVEFWSGSDCKIPKLADAPKLKFLEVHPVKPLVLAADKDGKVFMWDYSARKTVFSVHILSLATDRNVKPVHLESQQMPFTYASRTTQRSQVRLSGRVPVKTTKPNNETIIPSLKDGTVHANPASLNKTKQQLGQITQVCFADTSYMLSSTGLAGHSSNSSFAHPSNSESIVTIVCEGAVLFYDYVTGEASAVSPTEFYKATPSCVEMPYLNTCLIGCSDGLIRVWDWSLPVTAGVNYNANKLVGGITGFSPAKGAVALILQTHSKSEIAVIKSIPIKKYVSMLYFCLSRKLSFFYFYLLVIIQIYRSCGVQPLRSPSPLTLGPDQYRMRFISITVDGQALIWEIPSKRAVASSAPSFSHVGVTSAMDSSAHGAAMAAAAISGVLPLVRLKDSLGSSITRQHVSFDPETNVLHTCCNERRIRCVVAMLYLCFHFSCSCYHAFYIHICTISKLCHLFSSFSLCFRVSRCPPGCGTWRTCRR
jgi:WD40 repeat protein